MDDESSHAIPAGHREYALDGARDAIDRLAVTIEARAIAHAVAEASFWIAAVDENLGGKTSDSKYARACTHAGVRDLMLGIRYARNASVHGELARLALPEGGMTFPMTFPFTFEEVPRWISERLPTGSPGQLAAYQRALAGEDVLPTLKRAVDWLSAY